MWQAHGVEAGQEREACQNEQKLVEAEQELGSGKLKAIMWQASDRADRECRGQSDEPHHSSEDLKLGRDSFD